MDSLKLNTLFMSNSSVDTKKPVPPKISFAPNFSSPGGVSASWSGRALTERHSRAKFREDLVSGQKDENWRLVVHAPRRISSSDGISPSPRKMYLPPRMVHPSTSPSMNARVDVISTNKQWRQKMGTIYGRPLEEILGTTVKSDFSLSFGSSGFHIPAHRAVLAHVSSKVAVCLEDHFVLSHGDISGLVHVLQYIYLGKCTFSVMDIFAVWEIAVELGVILSL